MAVNEERLAKATPAQLEGFLTMNLSLADKRKIQAELKKRQEASPPPPNPATAPYQDNAPAFLQNMVPSAMQFGNDLLQGGAQMITNPVDTLAGLPSGIAQHYGERYSPLPGQPWYSGAAQTFNQDPVGFAADIVPVGSMARGLGLAAKTAGATKTGAALGTIGRGLEKADPAMVPMAAGQLVVAGAMNKIPAIRSPEEVMAGTYGKPRGAQTENLPGYLDTIGRAMDEGLEPTVAGAEAAKSAKRAAGEALSTVLDNADDLSKVDLIKGLEAVKSEFGTSLDGPALSAIDGMIDDVFAAGDPNSIKITAADANALKTKYDGIVNYDSATPSTDRIRQEGARAAAGVLRSEIADIPGAKPALDEYGQRAAVSDVVGRGAAADVAASGKGLTGDFVASALNAVAPVLTGQGKLKRNQIRRDLSQGRYGSAVSGVTERTVYGPLREGAYLAEMERTQDPDQQWFVGRLWSE